MLGGVKTIFGSSPPFHMGRSDVLPGFSWTAFTWSCQTAHMSTQWCQHLPGEQGKMPEGSSHKPTLSWPWHPAESLTWGSLSTRVLGRSLWQRRSHSSGDSEAWPASQGTGGTLESCPLWLVTCVPRPHDPDHPVIMDPPEALISQTDWPHHLRETGPATQGSPWGRKQTNER